MMQRQLILLLAVIFVTPAAHAADGDTNVANDLYSKPLTYRETPLGYRENPPNWTREPRNKREKPISYRPVPIGYREKPIPQLDEPRNGQEFPPRYVERDSITVANLDPELQTAKEDHLLDNKWEHLRIERQGTEKTHLVDDILERDPGYKGINPPSKARLPDFQ